MLRRPLRGAQLALVLSVVLNMLLLVRLSSTMGGAGSLRCGDEKQTQRRVHAPEPADEGPPVKLEILQDDDRTENKAAQQPKPLMAQPPRLNSQNLFEQIRAKMAQGGMLAQRSQQADRRGDELPVIDRGRRHSAINGDGDDEPGDIHAAAAADQEPIDAEEEQDADADPEDEEEEDAENDGAGRGAAVRPQGEDPDIELENEEMMMDLPYRGLLRERTPRVFVGVISGGSKPTTKANRDATLSTWFDENSYIATHEKVNTDRVMWLSDIAESGGFRELPRKVKHMWAYMYEHFLDQYDWFVKADDDTYINMPRLKKSLSVFNASMPVYLGKPFSTKVRGASGPGALWRDFTTMNFCHGGSGYILSRELLRRIGPYIRDAPVATSLEDAAVATVLYEHTGVRCINLNAKMFGGLDLVGNSHDQKAIMAAVSNYERKSPEMLWKTATIHSVTADTTYSLHSMYQRLVSELPALDDKVDFAAERDMEIRRWTLSSSWNCSVPPVQPTQPVINGICMQTALVSPPPFLPKHFADLEPHWQLQAAPTVCKLASGISSSSGGEEDVLAWATHSTDAVLAAAASASLKYFGPRAIPAADGDAGAGTATPAAPRDLLLTHVDGADPDGLTALNLMLRSLRATGSRADVVVFTTSAQKVGLMAQHYCGVQVATYEPSAVRSALALYSGITVNDDILAFGLYENYLHAHGDKYRHVMHAHVDTYFQRDPFATMTPNNGVVLFVDSPVDTMEQVACFSGMLRLNELVARLSLSIVLGVSAHMRSFYARAVTVPYRNRRCRFAESIMLQTFRKDFVTYFPVTLVSPWDGPVALLSEREEPRYRNGTAHNDGRLIFVNSHDYAATAVTNYLRLHSPSSTLLRMKPPSERKSVLDQVLSELPLRLHGTVRRATSVAQLTPQQWPPESKALLRWTALAGGAANTDSMIFKPVWEMLARYKMYNSNSSEQTKLAHVATHRTGAELLSGVLFRYAARHGRRVFHRGEWPFISTDILKAPQPEWRGQYDMVFDQLSPKGQWHGEFADALGFYRHVLGDNFKRLLMLQDPHQHYISWMYYYVIPKKTRYHPVDVVRDFVKNRLNRNLQCQELNLRTTDVLDHFINVALPRFELVLVRERLDESLVLLRRRLKWDLLDITFLAQPPALRRFDGRAMPPTPDSRNLPADIVHGIDSVTRMDRLLYDAANKRLDALIAMEDSSFKDEVEAFQKLQAAIADVCRVNSKHQFCRWYWMSEMDVISMLSDEGYSQAVRML